MRALNARTRVFENDIKQVHFSQKSKISKYEKKSRKKGDIRTHFRSEETDLVFVKKFLIKKKWRDALHTVYMKIVFLTAIVCKRQRIVRQESRRTPALKTHELHPSFGVAGKNPFTLHSRAARNRPGKVHIARLAAEHAADIVFLRCTRSSLSTPVGYARCVRTRCTRAIKA